MANLIHGMRYTKFYRCWANMKTRCYTKSATRYKNYGARGISVCEEWKEFKNFKKDMYKKYLLHSERYGEKQTTIDRINNDGNYEINNCKWSTYKEQENNRSHYNRNKVRSYLTFKGIKRSISQWAEELNIKRSTISQRYYVYKWSVEKCLTFNKKNYGN